MLSKKMRSVINLIMLSAAKILITIGIMAVLFSLTVTQGTIAAVIMGAGVIVFGLGMLLGFIFVK